jgi:hypothetical protein
MMNVKFCAGCEQNYYNGNNNLGVKQCWFLPTAKRIKRKRVHIDQVPPWNQTAQMFPNCYQQKRYIFVQPHQTY